MKKVLLFFVVAMALASCAPKAAETAPATDSTAVTVDSAAVDTAAADFEKLTQELDALGTKLGVDINIRNQEMYDAMHQL